MQSFAAKDQHGQHHELGRSVRNDGAANGRRDCVVNHLHRVHLPVATEIFPNPVKNNDRFIHGITQNGQHRRQHGQRKFPLEKRKKSQNNDDVVQVRDDRCNGKFPLEPNGQVNHDAGHHAGERAQTIGGQFVAHLRAHKFGTTQVRRGVTGSQSGHNTVTLLIGIAALLRWHANQHITGSTKILHLNIGNAQAANNTAHGV